MVDGTIRSGMEVTLFRFWRCDNRYHMVILEGRTAKPRIHLLGTNGLFETDEVDVREWFDEMVHEGMPHHVHVIQGRHRATLRKLGAIPGGNPALTVRSACRLIGIWWVRPDAVGNISTRYRITAVAR